ncbi:PD-(D/E)XK motif protein [Cognaticolwellia beringensis]|uniref:PD-(D/E)XK motif protein n=2 Tax=Cognaticolwellia beringensis TaxID=1967665 RepID=A0A222G5T5_9GAMM|nr:PD-(D/E)XK motif protein [Cognaticolwellia beringensis]
MMTMTKSNYQKLFNDDPWESLVNACYPSGRRLYLNDERFWVSIDGLGKVMFFVHEVGEFNIMALEGLAALDIQVDNDFIGATRLCCTLTDLNLELRTKFSIVAKDIAYNCSQFSGHELLDRVQARIKSWANFLKPQRTGLSEAEYIGLWGELFTLSEVILPYHSPFESIRFWVGPEGKKQDFTLNKIAVEVKTSFSSEARKITISSLEQLDIITENLYLLHIVANPSDSKFGYSLKDLYDNCLSMISQDLSTEILFIQKVFDLYGKASEKQLNSKNTLISQTLYQISDSFPCLRNSDVPSSIAGLRYDLLVSAIKGYESKKSIEEVIKNG